MTPPNFQDFYAYAFKYCLTGELDRLLPFFEHFNNMEITLFVSRQCSVISPLSLSLSLSHTHTHSFLASLTLMTFSEEKQKCVDIETICELLHLVLGSQFRAQVDSIIEYLKVGFLSMLI